MSDPKSKFFLNLLNAIAVIGIGLYYVLKENEELWGFAVPPQAGWLFVFMGVLWLYFLLRKNTED